MKRLLHVSMLLSALIGFQHLAAQGILGKVKDKVKDRANQKTDQAIDKGLDKTEDAVKGKKGDGTDGKTSADTGIDNRNAIGASPVIQSYQNYDFVPGDKILFEDNFIDDQDGEFPAHWELRAGQAVVNKTGGYQAFSLTDGNYARVSPRMKTASYLTDLFTIEYDYYYVSGSYGCMIMFHYMDKTEGFGREASVQVSPAEANFSEPDAPGFTKNLPAAIAGDETFSNKWHHVAVAYKNHQLKVYVDQYRVLVVPQTRCTPESIEFAGIGEDSKPIVFRNVRLASGGNMNMIGKKFTESKIVTHGINFDVGKAVIKPESMGTLNMIVQVMKDNPDLRFEVDGHTDNSGTPAHNLTLSQQRASAVKDQLVKMGIDASRLSSKGFGDTKPISDNTSSEGKANNRRVEFVKQ